MAGFAGSYPFAMAAGLVKADKFGRMVATSSATPTDVDRFGDARVNADDVGEMRY
jgi:hypothetical protein